MESDHYYIKASEEELEKIGATDICEAAAELNFASLTKNQCKQLIPSGPYCYTSIRGELKLCPFWDNFEQMPEQSSGFCHYLKQGDFTGGGLSLLWDMCKECGVNDDENL